MSKLYCAFSNIKALFISKGNGKVILTSSNNLSVNNVKFGRKNIIFEKVYDGLNTLKDKVELVRKVPRGSLEYSYFKTEYSRGSFCETVNGELLIPSGTVSYVKEKVH